MARTQTSDGSAVSSRCIWNARRRIGAQLSLGRRGAGRVQRKLNFKSWEPSPVGSHPAGASAFGVHDLVGNGWEWTRTEFAPFPGFTPMPFYPGYSANFFDGK